MTQFKKMHGLGNDFVIFDARTENLFLSPDEMTLIADRHWGVGCDQIIVIDQSDKADVIAFFFNADGSESGACGNGTRCVADIVMSETGSDICAVEVTYGVLNCRKKGELIEVDMGVAQDVTDLDLSHDGVSNPVSVNMGNPHCVFFVEDLSKLDVEKLGSHFEVHEQFPERTNVEFVEVQDRGRLRLRTWERGSGLTQACGSGACATIAACVHRDLTDRKVEIEVDGGVLMLEINEDQRILMTGPVAHVFDGTLNSV